MGDMVTGRVAETKGQSLSIPFDEQDGAGKFNYIIDVLAWRAQSCPENVLFSMVDSKVPTPSPSLCAPSFSPSLSRTLPLPLSYVWWAVTAH